MNSFGAHDSAAAEMNPRRQFDMGKVAGLFLGAILGTLKAGAPDHLGVARTMANLRNGDSAAVAGLLAEEEPDVTWLRIFADAYKAAARTGKKNGYETTAQRGCICERRY